MLPQKFYLRDTKRVARELLGKELFHKKHGVVTSGIITETEAYLGVIDPAAHTFEGRRTPRNENMYKVGGHSYVYFVYGMHFCFNVVTRGENVPEAVLIRGLEPCKGIKVMEKRRGRVSDLCNGPARLCEAMAIDRSTNGLSLSGSEIWIAEGIPFSKVRNKIVTSKRVGIDYAGQAKHWPLRFSL